MPTEYAYAERRVRELLGKGWQRKNIVRRVAYEIRLARIKFNPYGPAGTEGYAG